MKYRISLMVGVCLLFGSVPAGADQVADEAAIKTWAEELYAAYNNHDSTALLSLWVEDSESWDGTIKGRAAWEEYVAKLWGRMKGLELKLLDEIGIIFVTSDVAIYKFYDETSGYVGNDGRVVPPIKERNAAVLVKRDGKWLGVASFARRVEQ
jgi:hypothetical protein